MHIFGDDEEYMMKISRWIVDNTIKQAFSMPRQQLNLLQLTAAAVAAARPKLTKFNQIFVVRI